MAENSARFEHWVEIVEILLAANPNVDAKESRVCMLFRKLR